MKHYSLLVVHNKILLDILKKKNNELKTNRLSNFQQADWFLFICWTMFVRYFANENVSKVMWVRNSVSASIYFLFIDILDVSVLKSWLYSCTAYKQKHINDRIIDWNVIYLNKSSYSRLASGLPPTAPWTTKADKSHARSVSAVVNGIFMVDWNAHVLAQMFLPLSNFRWWLFDAAPMCCWMMLLPSWWSL